MIEADYGFIEKDFGYIPTGWIPWDIGDGWRTV